MAEAIVRGHHDFGTFQAYKNDMIANVLESNDVVTAVQATAARATGGSLLPWVPARVWGVAGRPLGVFGAFLARGTTGPAPGGQFGVPWTSRQQATFVGIAAASRASTPVLLSPLRHAGPLALKLRRREIAERPFSKRPFSKRPFS